MSVLEAAQLFASLLMVLIAPVAGAQPAASVYVDRAALCRSSARASSLDMP